MTFQKWLDTFVEEKEIVPCTFRVDYEGLCHFIEWKVLLEFLKGLDPESQKSIKDTFVKIDFMNGDPLHFLQHLAEGMVAMQFQQSV